MGNVAQPENLLAPTPEQVQGISRRRTIITITATFLLAMYVFVSLQFTEPGVQFIPHNAISNRTYGTNSTTFFSGDVQEVSFFWWSLDYEKNHEEMVKEIKALGFTQTRSSTNAMVGQLGDRDFVNQAGDSMSLGPKWEVASRGKSVTTGRMIPKPIAATQVQLVFVHTEKRVVPAFLKRVILWVKKSFR